MFLADAVAVAGVEVSLTKEETVPKGMGWWAEILEGLDHIPAEDAPRAGDVSQAVEAPRQRGADLKAQGAGGDERATHTPELPPWLRPEAWRATPPRGATLSGRRPQPARAPLAPRRIPADEGPGGSSRLKSDHSATTLTEELLPVLRGMERAYALARQLGDRLEAEETISDGLIQRQEMLCSSLNSLWARTRDILGYHGLSLIEPVGERFDPRRCLPIRSVRGTGLPDGTIVEVLSRGYARGDTVLARAEVTVAWERAPRDR